MSWSLQTIEEVCDLVSSGGTPRRSNPDYFAGQIPWVKTQELRDQVILDTEEHITESAIRESSAKLFPRNTLLFAMYGATAGKLAILGCEMACNQAACAMVVNPERADFRYLYYTLLHDRKNIVARANGAAQQNLNVGLIKGMEYRFPSLTEQRRIAGVLGALDDKIESNVTLAEKLSELADALALQLITDTQVAQAPLSDIADINVKSPLNFRFEEIEYLDIKSCSTGYFENTTRMKIADAPSRARRCAHDGDLIYSTVRPNRKVFSPIFDPVENLVISTGFAVVTPKFPTGTSFLAFVFGQDGFAEYLGAAAGGSAYPAVNIKAMESYPVTIPLDSSKMLAYEQSTLGMRRFASWLRRQNRKLAELRDALLPELMSGRMRVSEAGRLVSEVLDEEVADV